MHPMLGNSKKIKFKDTYRISSIRLKHWDYSENGYYFLTICTKNKECFFGTIENNAVQLSEIGRIVQDYWMKIPEYFPFTALDTFIVMPNHIHGIVIINNDPTRKDAIHRVSETGGITKQNNPMFYESISRIVRWYKGRCAFEINRVQKKIKFAWQPRFYDHIIRDDESLEKISQYIIDNPARWNHGDF